MTKFILFLSGLLFSLNCSAQNDTLQTRYIKSGNGYIVVLRMGDDVLRLLEQIAEREKIPFANFTAFGFVNARFGFFNFKTKQYKPKDFTNVEMASMMGSIAWKDGKPSIHAHGVVTDKKFKAHGGHILSATVSTGSLEVYMTVHDKQLERKEDPAIGANVLQLQDAK